MALIDLNSNVLLEIYNRLRAIYESGEPIVKNERNTELYSEIMRYISHQNQDNIINGTATEIANATEYMNKTRAFFVCGEGRLELNGKVFPFSPFLNTYCCDAQELAQLQNQEGPLTPINPPVTKARLSDFLSTPGIGITFFS
jgi:hypothetical protein